MEFTQNIKRRSLLQNGWRFGMLIFLLAITALEFWNLAFGIGDNLYFPIGILVVAVGAGCSAFFISPRWPQIITGGIAIIVAIFTFAMLGAPHGVGALVAAAAIVLALVFLAPFWFTFFLIYWYAKNQPQNDHRSVS